MKRIIIWLSVAMAAILGLSYLLNIPYIYTILGVAGWAFIGHIVTIDDDIPGEWSNPDGSANFWRSSKYELLIKFLVLIGILALIFIFPSIKRIGA